MTSSSPPDITTAAPSRASVVDLTFALWALLIPLLLHGRLLNADGDLARHLVMGEHILQHGPRFPDVFSFSRAGEPFLAYEWLSQVTLHLAHRLGGFPGIAVMAGGVIAAALALVVAYVRRRGGDPWLAYMTGAAAAVLSGPHWIARPHLFTLLALPILLHLLDEQRPRLLAIAALFTVWANLHPGFLYGVLFVAVVSSGRLLERGLARDWTRNAWAEAVTPLVVAVGASLINPFGWALHAHAITHLGNTEVLTAIDEFKPLDMVSLYGALIMTVTGAVVVGLSAQRERVPLDVLGAFLMGLFAAIVARRNGPLLAVGGLPMVARSLTPAVTRLPDWFAGRMRREFRRSDGRGRRASFAALVALATVLLLGGRVGGITLIPARFSDERFPLEAVRRAREAGLSGRLLTEYTWGGYVLHAWPEQRIFVDSMADFFGPELVYQYSMMRDAGPEWRTLLETHDISLVLLSPDAPLARELRQDRRWTLWHEDPTAVLFVRGAFHRPRTPQGR